MRAHVRTIHSLTLACTHRRRCPHSPTHAPAHPLTHARTLTHAHAHVRTHTRACGRRWCRCGRTPSWWRSATPSASPSPSSRQPAQGPPDRVYARPTASLQHCYGRVAALRQAARGAASARGRASAPAHAPKETAADADRRAHSAAGSLKLQIFCHQQNLLEVGQELQRRGKGGMQPRPQLLGRPP